MTIKGGADRLGGIFTYLFMILFAFHSAVICGLPMVGVHAIALANLIGTWPEHPTGYLAGFAVSTGLWVAIFRGSMRMAGLMSLIYGVGIAVIASLAWAAWALQVAILYTGFAALAIVASAAMFVGARG